ncbi:MAG TPA: hypothetical protein VGC47_05325 [Acidimicrobiia bacterium]
MSDFESTAVGAAALRDALQAVPGVAGALVTARDGRAPRIRVWLDGTSGADDVSVEVRRLLVDAGLETPDPADAPPLPGNGKKAGLGRGLGTLIPDAHDTPPPAHLQSLTPLRETSGPLRLERIAIEETATGVTVRAIDSVGRTAEVHVDGSQSALNGAIVSSVASIIGEVSPPTLLAAEVREIAGGSVLIAVLELFDGVRAVGAAVVGAGMPFTLGKAVWTAIEEARA